MRRRATWRRIEVSARVDASVEVDFVPGAPCLRPMPAPHVLAWDDDDMDIDDADADSESSSPGGGGGWKRTLALTIERPAVADAAALLLAPPPVLSQVRARPRRRAASERLLGVGGRGGSPLPSSLLSPSLERPNAVPDDDDDDDEDRQRPLFLLCLLLQHRAFASAAVPAKGRTGSASQTSSPSSRPPPAPLEEDRGGGRITR